jgi:hypothetical protein
MTAKPRRTTRPTPRPVPDPTQLEEKPAQVQATEAEIQQGLAAIVAAVHAKTPEPAAPADESSTDQRDPQESAPRRPDARVEVVVVGECVVDGCPVLEFEPGRGLCMSHFTTRLDLREAARHD